MGRVLHAWLCDNDPLQEAYLSEGLLFEDLPAPSHDGQAVAW